MSSATVLLLTDRGEWHQQAALNAAPPGLDVVVRRRPSEAELMTLLPGVEFLISERSESITAAMINAAPHLKLIIRLGSLSYNIDLEAARAKGVRVSVQPVPGSIYSAEHALLLILAMLKRLGRLLAVANAADHGQQAKRTDEDTFAFNWLGYRDIQGLYGKTVSIIGMGEIGVELARRLQPFKPEAVYYYKRTPYPASVERELGVTYTPLLDCTSRADVLVSLLPYSPETDRSIGKTVFEAMKPSASLVHVGSGSIIDEKDLVVALRNQKLAGAALDTYEYEPLQADHPLVTLARDPGSNVLLTPHTAAAYLPDDRSEDYGEIVRFLVGGPLRFEVKG